MDAITPGAHPRISIRRSMNHKLLLELTSQALWLSLVAATPVIVVASAVGLLVSTIQAVTSLQDSTVSQGIKLFASVLALLVSAPWAGTLILKFAETAFNAAIKP